jgi:hypothetical protein
MALQPLWTLISFELINLYTVGMTPWKGHQPVARPLPTHRTAKTLNEYTQISMPRVKLERTITVFERAKTAHVFRQRGHCNRLKCTSTARGVPIQVPTTTKADEPSERVV